MLFFLKCGAKLIGYFEICNIFAEKNIEMDKIIGLGNALVDVLATFESDEVLQQMGLPRGSMTLIDEERLHLITAYFKDLKTHKAAGGSAGNAIGALASLGASTGFVGKIGNDAYGDFLKRTLKRKGIHDCLLVSPSLPTGVASTFVSRNDGERTFATYLGAAASLKAEDLSLEVFKGYSYLFVEGYLVQDHDMILHAVELAKEAGLQVCLDMASYNIVEEDRDFFTLLLTKYVDIVFANEEEARAFTGKEPDEALAELSRLCSIAVVKLGARGSLVRKGTQTLSVEPVAVRKVADTTGAGDYFAAGFLYGLVSGCSLEKCARIASILPRQSSAWWGPNCRPPAGSRSGKR